MLTLLLLSIGALATSVSTESSWPPGVQFIDQRSFNVLENLPPPSIANVTTKFVWPSVTEDDLLKAPFHVYDHEFLDVIGSDPSLTLIAEVDVNPLFHEAVTWHEPRDEMFFVQHAGHPDSGTGLNKSAIIQKIRLAEAEEVRRSGNSSARVEVHQVPSNPQVINPNGAANYKGQIVFTSEGQGDDAPGALYLMNPEKPYNTTILVKNYFGIQLNSPNDVAVNPRTGAIYFTDPQYGYLLGFRPPPGLRSQVYKFEPDTGALASVADNLHLPNGIGFSPDGTKAYITDTAVTQATKGYDFSNPSSIYQFDVTADGTFENQKTFAYVSAGIPDGIHTDTKGRVYVGCSDGVHIYNLGGRLIGKIYTGITAANFQFAGQGRMIIMGETKLFYATLGASGAPLS